MELRCLCAKISTSETDRSPTCWVTSRGVGCYFAVVTFWVLFMSFRAAAAPLFEDDFSNEAFSDQNWALIEDGGGRLLFTGGKASLINNSLTYAAFALHSMRSLSSRGTFSVRINADNLGAGIVYGVRTVSGVICGTALIIGDGELVVVEYTPTGVVEHVRHATHFLAASSNVLRVSACGKDSLLFFCNGYYVTTLCLASSQTGKDIAIVVPPQSGAQFDDVVVEEEAADSTQFPDFADPLTAASTWGWEAGGGGSTNYSTQGLAVATIQQQRWFNRLTLPLAEFTATIVTRLDSSSRETFAYGFVLYSSVTAGTGLLPEPLFCGLTLHRELFLQKDSLWGISTSVHGQNQLPVFSGSGSDTLRLARKNGLLLFSVNRTMLVQIDCGIHNFAAVGLFQHDSGSAQYQQFNLVDHYQTDDVAIKQHPLHTTQKVGAIIQNIAVDLLGRVVSRANEKKKTKQSGSMVLYLFRTGSETQRVIGDQFQIKKAK